MSANDPKQTYPSLYCVLDADLLLTTQGSTTAIHFGLGNFASADQRGDTGIGQPVSMSAHTVF